MKKINCNEIPKDYRRNYKKEATEFSMIVAICTVGLLIVGFAIAFL